MAVHPARWYIQKVLTEKKDITMIHGQMIRIGRFTMRTNTGYRSNTLQKH